MTLNTATRIIRLDREALAALVERLTKEMGE
jgi:hypothetical protein